jgi:hypothetical protein
VPGLGYTLSTGETAMTGGVTRTMLILQATTGFNPPFVKGLEINTKGSANTDTPIKVELIRGNSLSGGTGGTTTGVVHDQDYNNGQIQSSMNGNYTVEPTVGSATVIRTWEVRPQYGLRQYWRRGDELRLKNTGSPGSVLTVRLTPTMNCVVCVNMLVEE